MRVLIDTHAVLWWDIADDRLSDRVRALLSDPLTDVAFSVASAWEIATKAARGNLELPVPAERYLPRRIAQYRWSPLAITVEHVIRSSLLPRIHADPFDRLLIAQAQVEGIPLVTTDAAITRYDVETIW